MAFAGKYDPSGTSTSRSAGRARRAYEPLVLLRFILPWLGLYAGLHLESAKYGISRPGGRAGRHEENAIISRPMLKPMSASDDGTSTFPRFRRLARPTRLP